VTVTVNKDDTCHICGGNAIPQGSDRSDDYGFSCQRCGNYFISFEALINLRNSDPDKHWILSAVTRQASEAGRPVTLTQHNLDEFLTGRTIVSVSRKIEKALSHVALKCQRPGAFINLDPPVDYPVADCADPTEFVTYLSHLSDRGLLRRVSKGVVWTVTPTIEGWQAVEPSAPVGGIPGRCFVAMSFARDLDEAYSLGIKPAIEDCGFKAICMKEIATNEGITDRILSEVRLAQFLVADFTGQRGGVYFEAGFARGLGRSVIWTCRRDEVSKLHFDTKHLGHVVWDAPADLRLRLVESIRANIIPNK
jgi:hypothetical protein